MVNGYKGSRGGVMGSKGSWNWWCPFDDTVSRKYKTKEVALETYRKHRLSARHKFALRRARLYRSIP